MTLALLVSLSNWSTLKSREDNSQKSGLCTRLAHHDTYHPTSYSFPRTSRLQILFIADGTWHTHLLLPVSWFVCHSRVSLSLCDCLTVHLPAEEPQSSALNSRWFLSLAPSCPGASASCLHKDVFMYVCMCRGEHGEVFFKSWGGGDKQRNLRSVNMDGVPAFRERRW